MSDPSEGLQPRATELQAGILPKRVVAVISDDQGLHGADITKQDADALRSMEDSM